MRMNTFTGLMAAALVGLGLTSQSVAAQQPAAPDAHHAMYDACAKVCADCMLTCAKTAHHCGELVVAGKKDHAKPAMMAAACAEFCGLSAKLTACHSELAATACEACAKACDACAAECGKFAEMPEMKACVESCKKCAASCREMMKHAHK